VPEYIVYVKEIHFCPTRVTADSPEDALGAVKEGDGDELPLQYVDTESGGWLVTEAPEGGLVPEYEHVESLIEDVW
jgi:hypothetical protein